MTALHLVSCGAQRDTLKCDVDGIMAYWPEEGADSGGQTQPLCVVSATFTRLSCTKPGNSRATHPRAIHSQRLTVISLCPSMGQVTTDLYFAQYQNSPVRCRARKTWCHLLGGLNHPRASIQPSQSRSRFLRRVLRLRVFVRPVS